MPTDLTKFSIPNAMGRVLNNAGTFTYDWWMYLQNLQGAVPAEGAGGISQIGIDQLTGDVTAGPGSGSQVATISANAVTYAKMQDISAASRLLGRGSAAGAGDPQEITLGSGLTMTGTTLAASGSGGTVTTTGSPASGNLTKFSGATSITNGDLSGDVTTSSTLVTTIANDAVTFAKMQNISTQRAIGRDTAGSGDPEEVTISQMLDWTP